jgi:vitellogenic carboxypeptidase-like protein
MRFIVLKGKADIQFGPYKLTDNLTLERNPFSWTRHFDVVFVDSPVGTGYSFVDPPAKVFSIERELMKISLNSLAKRFLEHHQADEEIEQLNVQPLFSDMPMAHIATDSPYDQGYVTNQDGVAQDMLAFLHKFYDNFPEKRRADLYLASESYGGITLHLLAGDKENMLHP